MKSQEKFRMFNTMTEQLQQSLIVTGVLLGSYNDGYIFGQMSGMMADIPRDMKVTEDELSWIASMINVLCIGGFAITTYISEKLGRKKSLSIMTIPTVVSWIMVFYANDIPVIMASRIIASISYGGVFYSLIISTAEYTAPKIRGLCLNFVFTVAISLGTTVGHILSMKLHWRTTALIGLVPSVLFMVIPFFWVESPSWLASNGKFKECELAFWKLHTSSPDAIKELQLLIEVERNKLSGKKKDSVFSYLYTVIAASRKKYFWKIVLIVFGISVYRTSAGKVLFMTFAVTIMQDVTGSKDAMYFTLLVDTFIIIGSCLSCVLIRKLKRRPMFFSMGSVANVILLVLTGCLYFKLNDPMVYSWAITVLLALYFILVYAGSYPALEILGVELIPLELKPVLIVFGGSFSGLMMFLSVKFATCFFTLMGYHGVFFCNAIITTICIAYFWFALPETKGKTLQEIELGLKNININDLAQNGQDKSLL